MTDDKKPTTWPDVAKDVVELIALIFFVLLTIWLCNGAPVPWKAAS